MKNPLIKALFVVVLITLVVITSCAKPAEKTTAVIPTGQPQVDTPVPAAQEKVETPLPPGDTQAPLGETPEPGRVLPLAGTVMRWIDRSDFVFVPGGAFIMGAESELLADFSPAHEVTISGFWIQQAEVTNQQYAQCVAAGECTPPAVEDNELFRYGDPRFVNYPVVGVDWYQAEAYCTYINSRLPTEAEWELTARGLESLPYPWGKEAPTCDLLNFDNCLDPSEPEDVRSYTNGASPYDAMDMLGNVYEWLGDWYQKDYYQSSPSNDPEGPDNGIEKVYRGGSYKSPVNLTSPILRFFDKPEIHSEELGFRCVLLGTGSDGLPAADGGDNSFYPPPCQVVAQANPGLVTGATMTPFPACEPASISGFCYWAGKVQGAVSGIKISLANCYADNVLNPLTGNGTPLDCMISGENPKFYKCDPPPGSAQGSVIELSYCHDLPPINPSYKCPAGYFKYSGDTFCEPLGFWLPQQPCPEGFQAYGQKSCVPEWKEWDDGCPSGFMVVVSGGGTTCHPMNQCLLYEAPESCEKLVCPQGQTYDPTHQCCAEPGPPPKTCPIGWAYNGAGDFCYVPERWPQNCFTSKVQIPYCPTLTPTPTPTPEPEIPPPPDKNCSNYSQKDACLANKCKWEQTIGAIGGSCVNP